MAIELPKDAEGREIPLDTCALYDEDGRRLSVFTWTYMAQRAPHWTVRFLFDKSDCQYYPEDYYLTPPDSWKALEDDLDRCWASTHYIPCEYFNPANDACDKCHANLNKECLVQMIKHIAQRVHKLRGEGE